MTRIGVLRQDAGKLLIGRGTAQPGAHAAKSCPPSNLPGHEPVPLHSYTHMGEYHPNASLTAQRHVECDMDNAGMIAHWNGRPGDLWATEAERFDAMLAPFSSRLLEAVDLKPGERVLDVGCGNGAVSLDAARAVGSDGSVTGLDLSAPMLQIAQQRATEQGLNVDFVEGDAQSASFDQPFDVVLSRFGVMFFDDPKAAFANFARATRPGGRLGFVCWQEMLANEWIAVPAMAAVAHVGVPELPEPGAPSPFSMADKEWTRALLDESGGWSGVAIEEHTEQMQLGHDAEDVIAFLLSDEMGRRLVDGKDPKAIEAATEAAVEALRPFETPEGVVLKGAYWLVTGQRT